MNKKEWNYCKNKFCLYEKKMKTLYVFVFDFILIYFSYYLLYKNKSFFIISILLLSFPLFHFYLLLHEATHSAVFYLKFINNFVGHICGWIILMPFLARQRSHLLHHIWTGHPTGDPANKRLIKRFSVINQKQKKILEWIWRYWIPLITLNDRIGLWKDAFQEKRNGNLSKRITDEIQIVYVYLFFYFIFIVFLIYQGIFLRVMMVYFPALIIQFYFEELANAPHHAEAPLININDNPLPYWEQDKVTHSCKSFPIWSKFILLNFNLHTAHHYFPWAPWYHLPKLHSEIIKLEPQIELARTQNEISWSISKRKKPLLSIMAHYFDKIEENKK